MIRAYQPLRKFLGIEKIQTGIGGSMGGQQLLEWAIEEPDLFEYIFPMQQMRCILPGVLLSMHLKGWVLKQMVPGR